MIWEATTGWQYDDSNATNLSIAQSTLVHRQQDYSLPTTAQRVDRVDIKDNGGTWHKVEPIDSRDVLYQGMASFESSPGLPMYYDLIGRSIMLYPAPSSASCTLASGIAIYVEREVTNFATSASSSTPGFPVAFHRLLSYAAALDFSQDEVQRKFLQQQKYRLEQGLIKFYSKRDVEYPTRIVPASQKRWRQYQ